MNSGSVKHLFIKKISKFKNYFKKANITDKCTWASRSWIRIVPKLVVKVLLSESQPILLHSGTACWGWQHSKGCVACCSSLLGEGTSYGCTSIASLDMAPFDTSYLNCFLPDPIRISIKVLRGATVTRSLALLVHAEPMSCIATGMFYAWACLNNCRPASPDEHRKMAGGSEPTENIQKRYEPINHF